MTQIFKDFRSTSSTRIPWRSSSLPSSQLNTVF